MWRVMWDTQLPKYKYHARTVRLLHGQGHYVLLQHMYLQALLSLGVVERSKDAMETDFGLCGIFGVFSIQYGTPIKGGG